MKSRYSWLSRGAVAGVLSLGALAAPVAIGTGLSGGSALALLAKVPNRCFTQTGTTHVVFGPEAGLADPPAPSPNTSFTENTGPSIATLPLHVGTSPRGTTYYIFTDASDLTVATALGINYAPKLGHLLSATALSNGSVQDVTGQDVGATHGDGIAFPASVNFAPAHFLV